MNNKELEKISLFQGLSAENYTELADIVVDRQLQRGQFIFNEGDEATGFYVLISGRIKIYKLSFDGKEQILHILGPGEPFAEVAVFSGMAYPANAMALEKSTVFFFAKDAFVRLIGQNPSLAMNMLATLSLRLKQFTHMIEALSLKEVPGRLATHLLLLSKQNKGEMSVKLNITKTQLASLLGTIPETMSRILTKMNKQRLIESKGADITLLDLDGLDELATGLRKLV
jgi:CRP/FNR family transcriptional regulator